MPRIRQLDVDSASGYTKKLFRRVEEGLGVLPNMFKCMGNSDMALDGFLVQNANLGAGKLGPKKMKMIILATSELNKCEYCCAAHAQMAKDAGLLTEEECLNARRLVGDGEQETAMLKFVGRVHETKGDVSDADLQAVRKQGFGDEEIVEMLGIMALITFANYTSNVGEPDLDFPEAPAI